MDGAAYLVYLGFSALRDRGRGLVISNGQSARQELGGGFLAGVSERCPEPKSRNLLSRLLTTIRERASWPTRHSACCAWTHCERARHSRVYGYCRRVGACHSEATRQPKCCSLSPEGMGLMFIGLGIRLATEKV